jgi:DNA-binding NtrC family response regulator
VVLVVQLSESFADLWSQLASDLGAELMIVAGSEPPALGPHVAVAVLAAGGAEREALQWLDSHELPGSVPLIAVGSDPGRRIASQLVGHGAADYFALPEDVEILRNAIAAGVRRRREASSRAPAGVAASRPEAFAAIVGDSPALKDVIARAVRLLPHVEATALIVGETGTGKELLARAIHEGGRRHAAPFVTVNCSALPNHLMESELFGHERGAFTEAHATKPGLFEVADGGTLFLDEIGTMPADLQAKRVRVLDDTEVRRVGGTTSRMVYVRIIAATNANV